MKATLWLLGAMELLKLHFIASYGFLALGGAFPYLPATLAFFLSMALSRFLRGKGMRLIFFAFFETIAFAVVFVGMYSIYRGGVFDLEAIPCLGTTLSLSLFLFNADSERAILAARSVAGGQKVTTNSARSASTRGSPSF